MSNEVYVGDIGTKIILNTVQVISTATVRKIYYEKPDGTTGFWTALENTTTSIYFTTTAVGDLDVAGEWKFQSYLELSGGWEGHGKVAYKEVLANLT